MSESNVTFSDEEALEFAMDERLMAAAAKLDNTEKPDNVIEIGALS